MRSLIAPELVRRLIQPAAQLFEKPPLRAGRYDGAAGHHGADGRGKIRAAGISTDVARCTDQEVRDAVVLVDGSGEDQYLATGGGVGDPTGSDDCRPGEIRRDEAGVRLLANGRLDGSGRIVLQRADGESCFVEVVDQGPPKHRLGRGHDESKRVLVHAARSASHAHIVLAPFPRRNDSGVELAHRPPNWRTSSSRSRTRSFLIIEFTCVRTVTGESTSRRAISEVLRPCRRRSRTCHSRLVSCAS